STLHMNQRKQTSDYLADMGIQLWILRPFANEEEHPPKQHHTDSPKTKGLAPPSDTLVPASPPTRPQQPPTQVTSKQPPSQCHLLTLRSAGCLVVAEGPKQHAKNKRNLQLMLKSIAMAIRHCQNPPESLTERSQAAASSMTLSGNHSSNTHSLQDAISQYLQGLIAQTPTNKKGASPQKTEKKPDQSKVAHKLLLVLGSQLAKSCQSEKLQSTGAQVLYFPHSLEKIAPSPELKRQLWQLIQSVLSKSPVKN
ncbi:MAG: hypothetical protein ACR2PW_08765, partial [Gammaproteobacteria bacterium]